MNRKGIILVEAIIAVVIMAISLTVIMQSLLGSYRSVTLQKDYTQALLMVENRLAKYWFNGQDVDETGASKSLSKFTYQSTIAERDMSLKTAALTIQWPVGNGQRKLSVSSLVYVPNSKTK